ncbi:MAG: efflux RND transporter periplasmic adaptor subunit, partial [Muribaculaceae bacterium]|nr:efflux RND transporter periplasmic adaptor subunit [Muribaculaceae bacterium]
TVDKDNVLHQQTIQIAPLQDGKNYVVTAGLAVGDRIVTEGIGTKARNGITINVAGQQPAAPAQEETK